MVMMQREGRNRLGGVIKSERLDSILERVLAEGVVTVDELCEEHGTSPATARRDLDELANRGLIRRTRGGAHPATVSFDMTLRQKRNHQAEEKAAIARLCLTMLSPGDAIGLTGGTTVGAFAKAILDWAADRPSPDNLPVLTVVTNALNIASVLSKSPSIRTVVIGGVLNPRSLELTGPFGADTLSKLSLDSAFIGVNGVGSNGPGTVDELEGAANRLLASRARRAMVLADSSKFGRQPFFTLGGPAIIDTIVTDDNLNPSRRAELNEAGYRLLIAPTGRPTEPSSHSHSSTTPPPTTHAPRHIYEE